MRLDLKIKELRKVADMTQQDLADQVYVTRAVISMWETGRRNPNTNYVIRMCQVFKTTPNDFLEFKQESKR